MDKITFLTAIQNSHSRCDVCTQLNWPNNGNSIRKINLFITEFNVDISHFDGGRHKRTKYKRIKKICPVCKNEFEASTGHKKEKVTCSRSCSNSYFRSGTNHPNWKDSTYRTTCFYYHNKKCIVCDESNIVTVHHYDENSKNNSAENLIPLCPTHHHYMHSSFKHLIEKVVDDYRDNFILNFK